MPKHFVADKYRSGSNSSEALQAVLNRDDTYASEIMTRFTDDELFILVDAALALVRKANWTSSQRLAARRTS